MRQRRVGFDGAINFRDLGGYATRGGRQVRWGRLYRSDSLSDLTAADLERLRRLNLHTLVDFRVAGERRRKPNRLPPDMTLRMVDAGFLASGAREMLASLSAGWIDAAAVARALLGHYRDFPVKHNLEYRQMLQAVEEADGKPVLFHCASGKDRTGFGAAALLLALGVSREDILTDYALTNDFRRDISDLVSPDTDPTIMEALTAARPEYLLASFETIDAVYGSDENYLRAGLELTPERQERLADLLTETPPPEASEREASEAGTS